MEVLKLDEFLCLPLSQIKEVFYSYFTPDLDRSREFGITIKLFSGETVKILESPTQFSITIWK